MAAVVDVTERVRRRAIERDRYRDALEDALARLAEARNQALAAAFQIACARVWSEWDQSVAPGTTVNLASASFGGCGDPHAEAIARIADAIDEDLARIEDALEESA